MHLGSTFLRGHILSVVFCRLWYAAYFLKRRGAWACCATQNWQCHTGFLSPSLVHVANICSTVWFSLVRLQIFLYAVSWFRASQSVTIQYNLVFIHACAAWSSFVANRSWCNMSWICIFKMWMEYPYKQCKF